MGRRTRSSKSRKSQLRNRRPTTPVARKRPGHRLATQRPSRIPPRWPCRLRRRPCTRRTSAADVVDQRNAFAKAETAGELTAARASKALQAVATCVAGVEPGSGASGAPHDSRGKSQPRRRHRCRGHGGRGATAALSARQAKRCRRRSYIHDRISRSGRASLCVHIQLRPEFKMNPSEFDHCLFRPRIGASQSLSSAPRVNPRQTGMRSGAIRSRGCPRNCGRRVFFHEATGRTASGKAE